MPQATRLFLRSQCMGWCRRHGRIGWRARRRVKVKILNGWEGGIRLMARRRYCLWLLVSAIWARSVCISRSQLSTKRSSRDRLCALDGHLALICKFIPSHWLSGRLRNCFGIRISPSTLSSSVSLPSSASIVLVRCPIIECRYVYSSGIFPRVFR